MTRRRGWPLWATLMLLAAAVVLGGCGGNQATGASQNAQMFNVVMSALKFQPERLVVAAGKPVTVNIENKDVVLHDWSIEKISVKDKQEHGAGGHDMGKADPAVHVALDAGKKAAVQFTPTQAGNYEFTCTVPGHKEAGMRGTLTVQSR